MHRTCLLLTRTRVIALAAAIFLLVTAYGPPVAAESVRVKDRRDDVPRAAGDVLWVRYSNAVSEARSTARIRNLKKVGRYEFVMARPGTDYGYVASVRLGTEGGVRARLARFPADESAPCRLTGTWRADANRVSVAVPRRCIADLPGRLYLGGHFVLSGQRDSTSPRLLARG